jgi:hypothetical protein
MDTDTHRSHSSATEINLTSTVMRIIFKTCYL